MTAYAVKQARHRLKPSRVLLLRGRQVIVIDNALITAQHYIIMWVSITPL